jgi:hypothetical protein
MSFKEVFNDSAVFNWLTKNRGENLKELIKVNRVRGSIMERILSEYFNSEFTDAHGSDEINQDGKLVETKITKSINLKKFEIGNIISKRGKCDIIRIVDLINYRIFEIPHDEFFKYAKFNIRGKTRRSDSLLWSASYNKSDRIEIGNTQLLLDNEIFPV